VALMLMTGVATVMASFELVLVVLVDELPPPHAASIRHSRAAAR
jgi:hypothetical protein